MSKQLTFPEDFTRVAHEVIKNATQWIATKANKTKVSIVGGGKGLLGDGVETFEMWDFDEAEPQGYLTKEEINTHLKS